MFFAVLGSNVGYYIAFCHFSSVTSNLWQIFGFLFSFKILIPLRVLARYFVNCLMIWVCLSFFSWFYWGMVLRRNSTEVKCPSHYIMSEVLMWLLIPLLLMWLFSGKDGLFICMHPSETCTNLWNISLGYLCLLCKWGNWGTKKPNHPSKFSELVSGTAENGI